MLTDGQTFAFDKNLEAWKSQASSPTLKAIDDEPETDYVKVPCKFTGWKLKKANPDGSFDQMNQRDILKKSSNVGLKMR